MRKADRHLLIKQLILHHRIGTQEELLQLLEKQGVQATQATISRDIRDLQIVKAPDENGQTYFQIFQDAKHAKDDPKEEQRRLAAMIHDVVTKVERVQFLTIIGTLPDNAPLLTAMIDDMKLPNIVSTIAGFDTIVIISRDEEQAKEVEQLFLEHRLH